MVYTITEVRSPTRFIVEGCKAVTLRKNGQWRFEGETMRGGAGIMVGMADEYRDPSF